jgi:phospholipid/cholesterol/gamma-HCH transport system substrate-binding protein
MRSVSGLGRVAAIAAVIAAIVLIAIVLFGGISSPYTVKARFLNAGQLVKGNPVQVGGVPIGSVTGIRITNDGLAEITLEIKDKDYVPLRQGTRATIRQFSQSGIANRYVDLTFPSGSTDPPTIENGGAIGTDNTKTAVDLDQLFNTLDPKTRRALQGFFKGSARMFQGEGDAANRGLQYLNPALATSSRLFSELTRDTPLLERFLVDSSRLLTTLSERKADLAGLVSNLDDTTRALGDQQAALAESIAQLPPFMRQANTTFVDLRAALNDVDPLVNAAKPVARRLGPFLNQARALTHDAKPTVRDLSRTISRSGPANDLIDYMHSIPPLEDAALVTKRRSVSPGGRRVDVGVTRGAFPETAGALTRAAPEIAFARPYTSDLLGWFDDFSTTGGGFDALGAYARGQVSLEEALFPNVIARNQFRRCPGGADPPFPDGSNVFSAQEQRQLDCTEADRAVQK